MYELRKATSESNATFTLKKDEGAFELSWDDSNNQVRAGVGLLESTGEEVIEFAADIESNSTSYISTYGVFLDTTPSKAEIKYLAEFSIIENTIGWNMSYSMTPIDSIYSDGSYYIIYARSIFHHHVVESYNYNYYHFVRQENRTEGTVTFNNYYKKLLEIFEENNQRGELLYSTFGVETISSTGTCDMHKLIINSGFPEDPDVEFTSIQPYDEFTIGNEVSISADISPKQGTIEKIEFFVGNEKIGETTQAPYEIVWISDTVGSIPITIIATDTDGWDTKKTVAIVVKEKPITHLAKGWNLIGYANNSAPIKDALADIWDYVEIVKDFDSFYMLEMHEELNSLQELTYGKGYYIKVAEDCSLEWQIH